jgi:hypothetical protein
MVDESRHVRQTYLSPCRTWRYSLTRDVAASTGAGTVAFVGLNPSSADETTDDPTIRRCTGFARRWGFARLAVINLYAYRERHPRTLATVADPVGPENDDVIAEVVEGSDLVVCAWGAWAGPFASARVARILDLVAAPHCLGLTKHGAPRHPLYVRADALPVRLPG